MDFQPYIRASWEIVMECESRTKVNLDEELEAYLVYMVARNFRNPDFPPDVICLEFTKARTRDDFRQIGDSCLTSKPGMYDAPDSPARTVTKNWVKRFSLIYAA